MKGLYSHQWLQTFFDTPLPSPNEVAEGLLKHSFEVEEVQSSTNGDTVYELDVLPNRSADCLAHYGIAKEISAIFSLPLKRRYFQEKFSFSDSAEYIQTEKCDRYTILKITDIALKKTPDDIQRNLEAIRQRCINPIVDLSNHILFDIGQPIHAFDAQKVSGQFGVRQARTGEKITLLGDEEVVLQECDIVITDATKDKPIALAGVKGGEETKVDNNTKDIFIEIATFDSQSIRRTARRTGYMSDASLRFSQGFPAELIDYTAHQVAEMFGQYGSITDSYDHQRTPIPPQHTAEFSVAGVNTLLGTTYTKKDITSVLDRLGFVYKSDAQERYAVTTPVERPDVQDENDLIEEVGRVLGYDSVPSIPPTSGRLHILWTWVRNQVTAKQDEQYTKRLATLSALQHIGFSEVMTSSFRAKDKVCVAYPVAKDKGCLRSSLRSGIKEALDQNAYNGELLGLGAVQIAEIGSVFTKNNEQVHLALGVRETLGRKKVDHTAIEKKVRHIMNIPGGFEDGVWEVPLKEVQVHTRSDHNTPSIGIVQYTPPSKYPFVLRDVAVFVPNGVDTKKTEALLRKSAGDYLRQIILFDAFKKDSKQSYAFRLVFQSDTETLDDTAVNKQMDSIYEALKRDGYEVR